jgi:hypothetical protein
MGGRGPLIQVKGPARVRRCLGCEKRFRSVSVANRMCRACRYVASSLRGALGESGVRAGRGPGASIFPR